MYVIDINGDLEQGDNAKIYTELDHLSVQLSINEDGVQPQHRCSNCGEKSSDDTPDEGECPGSGFLAPCPECAGDRECPECDEGVREIHAWESIPLHWCNSASIHARPDRDRIDVTISVSDPRGAFVMSIERTSDGELRLSVPHAGMGMPHAELTERSPGWFKVG